MCEFFAKCERTSGKNERKFVGIYVYESIEIVRGSVLTELTAKPAVSHDYNDYGVILLSTPFPRFPYALLLYSYVYLLY